MLQVPRQGIDLRQCCLRPLDLPRATAGLSRTIGAVVMSSSKSYRSIICRQSVAAQGCAFAWQATMAASTWYGPGRPSAAACSIRDIPSIRS